MMMSELHELVAHAKASCWMVEQAGIDGVTLFSPGSGQRVTYSRLSDYYKAMSEHELAAAARKKESSSRP